MVSVADRDLYWVWRPRGDRGRPRKPEEDHVRGVDGGVRVRRELARSLWRGKGGGRGEAGGISKQRVFGPGNVKGVSFSPCGQVLLVRRELVLSCAPLCLACAIRLCLQHAPWRQSRDARLVQQRSCSCDPLLPGKHTRSSSLLHLLHPQRPVQRRAFPPPPPPPPPPRRRRRLWFGRADTVIVRLPCKPIARTSSRAAPGRKGRP